MSCCKHSMNIHWKFFSTFSLGCNKTTGFPIGVPDPTLLLAPPPPPPPHTQLSRLTVARYLCCLLLYPPSVSPAGLAWASWGEGGEGSIKDDSKKYWDSSYMLFPLRSKCFIFVPGILENMFFICGAERRGGEGDGEVLLHWLYVRLYNVHALYNAGSVIVYSSWLN